MTDKGRRCISSLMGMKVKPGIRVNSVRAIHSPLLGELSHSMPLDVKTDDRFHDKSPLPYFSRSLLCRSSFFSVSRFLETWGLLCTMRASHLISSCNVPGSPSDLKTGNRIEAATGCPSWCRALRPLFHFLCSNLKANPVYMKDKYVRLNSH